MTINTCVLSLLFALPVSTAAAQTQPGPIVNGRQPQPTAQKVESKSGNRSREQDARDQSNIDRLYDQIMRAAAPQRR